MPADQPVAKTWPGEVVSVLGVDTCGPSGSVALALLVNGNLEILGQKELAGRTYSATLVSAIAELLEDTGLRLSKVDAIVVVNGPGSFTGVRVGLSAVKGLAEPRQIPVVAVSRLEGMAAKAGVGSAALDAHRNEVFLRILERDGCRELLAGAEELAGIRPSGPVAVCDESAELLLKQAWEEANLVRTLPPTAADAIQITISRVLRRDFADLSLLDGHYLRRSDAEIFGERPKIASNSAKSLQIRRANSGDIDAIAQIAQTTKNAPEWSREVYEKALDPSAHPRRLALIAEEGGRGGNTLVGFAIASVTAPEAELETIVTAVPHQRRGVARELFSFLKNELRHQEIKELFLEVREGNHAARGFYRFLGFKEDGRRKAYYAHPVEDAILMRLSLG